MTEKRIRYITVEKLLEMMENKDDFKLIEVLSKDEFDRRHIPNAINIPVQELEEKAEKELDKEEKIVLYCGNYSCGASTEATRLLLEKGFKNVVDFKAGKFGWRHSGLPLV